MALREKLAERARPHLEPGEQIQSIFLAQGGPSPYWILLSNWIVIFGAKYRIVVVTDRAIVLLRAGRIASTKPKKVELRWQRNVWLGQLSGLWGQVTLDRRYWVHKRFHKDVAAADEALRAMYPQQSSQQYQQYQQPQQPQQ